MKALIQTNTRKLTIVLVLAGFVLFGQSLNDPFHFDDVLIINDSNVANAANWQHFLNPLQLRQFTFFTFYLNHRVAGNNPGGYHLVNVAIHIANVVLFFALLRSFLDTQFAFIAAFIFLAHPIQTEPVMYVYQRSVLLACFFSLLALVSLQRNRMWIAVLMFFFAFESKESSVAVPLLVAIMYLIHSRGAAKECSPGREPGATLFRRSAAGLLLLVLALSATAIGILIYQQESTVGIGAAQKVSPIAYMLTETRVVYTYLRLLVFPFPQSLEYDFASLNGPTSKVVVQILGVLLMIAMGFWLARREHWRVTGLAILAFFVLLAPTSSIIPSTDFAFEHRLYLPMLAFSVFAGSIIVRLKRPVLVAALLLLILSITTIHRGTVWASDAALWEDTVRHVPGKARAWFNLGGAYIQSNPDRARVAYNRAIELKPDFAQAYYNLGVIDQFKGNYRQAAAYYDQTVNLDPGYWPAWNNLGNTLMSLGDKEYALKAFEKTLHLNPDHWPSQYNIAIVHFDAGRFAEAIPRLRTVLDWRPDFRDARYLLAVSLSNTGQREEADREWRKLGKNVGQLPLPATIPGVTR